jgi:tetratricopeptide (TPR) repeat protein
MILLALSVRAGAQETTPKDTVRSLDPGMDLYKVALKQIDSIQYKEAIKTLTKAIKAKPPMADAYMAAAYNKMASCKMQLKDYKGARKDLQQSVRLAPDNMESLKYLGKAFFYNQEYDSAKMYYDSAFKVAHDDPELLLYIAELKVVGKDIKGAVATLGEAIFIKGNYAPALFRRGILKYQLKEYNYAIKDISDGLRVTQDTTFNLEVYSSRAKAYFEVGNYKGALQDYDKILQNEPKNEEALTSRGATKVYLNDNSGAVDDLTKAIEINKKSFAAYNFRGTAKSGLKQYVEALKDFDMSIKLKFDYASAYVNRAAAKMASKDKKGACKDLEQADQLGSEVAYKLIQQYCNGF